MAGFQHPIDARPADAERLGDCRGIFRALTLRIWRFRFAMWTGCVWKHDKSRPSGKP